MKEVTIIEIKYKDDVKYLLFDNDESTVISNGRGGVLTGNSLKELSFPEYTYVEDIASYNFDLEVENPIDYNDRLQKWNLLYDIARISNHTYFEGNSPKVQKTYDLLFCLCTYIDELDNTLYLPQKYVDDLKKVFGKAHKVLRKIF